MNGMHARTLIGVLVAVVLSYAAGRVVLADERIPAFPGAEGAGAYATGGRGGTVFHVTSLEAFGPGTLADAVSQPNRIIVFELSGIIDLTNLKKPKAGKIIVEQPNLTIAGQTAPGEGICIKGGAFEIKASNVIVRHLRSRRGFVVDSDSGDAIEVKPNNTEVTKTGEGTPSGTLEKIKKKKEERGKGDKMKEPQRIENILLDHLSASWATDENLTLTHPNNSTAQWCIASEGLDYSNPKQTPPNHSEGSLWGVSWPDGRSTMHHMLYAHNRLRNPRTTGGTMPPAVLEFCNSVVYDCSEYQSHTGSEAVYLNWINNYYKAGPSTPSDVAKVMFSFHHSPLSRMFNAGNIIESSREATRDNWQAVQFDTKIIPAEQKLMRVEKPFETPTVKKSTAAEALEQVLADAGATLPSRDAVDLRIVNDVRSGKGRVINKETDLAAEDRWPDYHTLPRAADTDNDGIPDFWEKQFALNSSDAPDAMKITAGGYANIEHYFNNTDPTGSKTPIVYIAGTASRADSAKGQAGELRVTRTGDDSAALTIAYSVSGTAAAGKEYTPLAGTVTIPAHAKSARIPVTAIQNAEGKAGKTVVVTLEVGAAAYHAGCPSAAMVVIRN